MIAAVAVSVVGLVLLARAADWMVVGAARLAAALRVSPVVIGAIVIGFGTSAPEMLVSGLAAGQDSLDIAVGNIIGSNIANLTLVLGAAALLCRLEVGSRTLRREAPLSAATVVVFAVAVQDGLSRIEGVLLVVLIVAVVGTLLYGAGDQSEVELSAEVEEFLDEVHAHRTSTEAVRTLVGLVGTLAGAQALVWGATTIASEVGLEEGFVGLTLVALGTSLPELVTAVAAARRQEDELIIGNLLGSNMFNSLAVGATAALVGPGPLADAALSGFATYLMVGVALAAWMMMATGRTVVRWEGVVLLGVYVVAVPSLAL